MTVNSSSWFSFGASFPDTDVFDAEVAGDRAA